MKENLLNQEQAKAAYSSINGHTLVVAPAGTGKTEVLVNRIIYLLQNSVKPEEICAITYTNFAARSMQERIKEKLLDVRKIPLFMGTIHSLCKTILKYEIDLLGEPNIDNKFKVLEEDQQFSLLISKKFRQNDKLKWSAEDFKKLASKHKVSKYLNPKETTDLELEGLENVYKRYEKVLREENKLDFDDLLIYADKLLATNEYVSKEWGNKFKAILIDECQDLTLIQFELIKKLVGTRTIVFAVGDPNQCIFLFGGAQSNIFDMLQHFLKDKQCLRVDLIENYRSAKKIVEYSNKIKRLKPASKAVRTEEGIVEDNDEIDDLIQKIRNEKGATWAILSRCRSGGTKLIESAIENKILFKVSEFGLLNNPKVKIIIHYLRLIFFDNSGPLASLFKEQFKNEALKDEIFKIPTSISYLTSYQRLLNETKDNWIEIREDNDQLNNLLEQLRNLRKNKIFDLSNFVKELVDLIFCDKSLKNSKQKVNLFIKWLDTLQQEKTWESAEKIVLDIENKAIFSKEPAEGEYHECLTLITIHKAKGLEWDNVVVLGYDELAKSAKNDRDDDRFLQYVAVTRPRNKLYLVEGSPSKKKSKK